MPYIVKNTKVNLESVFVIFFFTLMSICSIHRYAYGNSDHAIVIPFLKAYINPSLYQNDYLVNGRNYLYTVLWVTLGILIKLYHISIPMLFFLCYFISLFMIFYSIYLLSITLWGQKESAYFALFLFLFLVLEGAGGETIIDNLFITRVVALPLLLIAFNCFLRENFFLSFFLLGLAFLIHALSAAYVFFMLAISSLVNIKKIGVKNSALCFALFLITISPLIIWKFLYPASSLGIFSASPQWVELLKIRSSHHTFPLSWNWFSLVRLGLITSLFIFISFKTKPNLFHHKVVSTSIMTILGLFAIGTLFTEFYPIGIVLQFQLFRSSIFLLLFTGLYIAHYIAISLFVDSSHFVKVSALLAPLCFLELTRKWIAGYAGYLGFFVFVVFYFYKYHDKGKKVLLLWLMTMVFALSFFCYAFRSQDLHLFKNVQEKTWLETQNWAKGHTNPSDIFIVPPYLEGFRVESERAIYGDWKDGTHTFFDPVFGNEWLRRMQALGFRKDDSISGQEYQVNGKGLRKAYQNLTESDFSMIAKGIRGSPHKIFVVKEHDGKPLNFSIAYQNNKFVVYGVGQ